MKNIKKIYGIIGVLFLVFGFFAINPQTTKAEDGMSLKTTVSTDEASISIGIEVNLNSLNLDKGKERDVVIKDLYNKKGEKINKTIIIIPISNKKSNGLQFGNIILNQKGTNLTEDIQSKEIYKISTAIREKTTSPGSQYYGQTTSTSTYFYPEPNPIYFSTQVKGVTTFEVVGTQVYKENKNNTNDGAIAFDPQKNKNSSNGEYKLLAPLGKDYTKVETNNIGKYFNILFNLAIGLAGALAVIMLVIGGVQWMGSESFFGKTEAKKRITSAILGLLIALGSYALLNTINPDLLGKKGLKIDQVSIEIVNLPDVGDGSVDPDFKTGKGSYSTNTPVSPGMLAAINKIKQGWEINQLKVSSGNNKMLISLKKGGDVDNTNIVSISPGQNGYSEIGVGTTGDGKTPKGSWKILSVRTSGENNPVYSKTGSNMGASFWLLNPTTTGERGIGIHGNKNGTLGLTNGCIRLTNSDLLALLPYIKTGISVIIQ